MPSAAPRSRVHKSVHESDPLMILPHEQKILDCLTGLKPTRNGHDCRCPAHQDRTASLSVAHKGDRVVIHCHAGCTDRAVLNAIGKNFSDLYPPREKRESRLIATYDYTDATRTILYQVLRFDPKEFRQRSAGGGSMDGIARVLYRWPDLASAQHIIITDGEKDVENLRQLKLTATCCSGGGSNWHLIADDSVLKDKKLTIIIDKDKTDPATGKNPGRDNAKFLLNRFPQAKAIYLPGQTVKDTTNWIEVERFAGLTDDAIREKLLKLVAETPSYSFLPAIDRCRAALNTIKSICEAVPDICELNPTEFITFKDEFKAWKKNSKSSFSLTELQQLVDNHHKVTRQRAVDPQRILVTGRTIHDMASDAVSAIIAANTPPEIYLRLGKLSRLRQDEDDRQMIELADRAYLRGRMSRTANWVSINKDGEEKTCAPPIDVVDDILSMDVNRELSKLKLDRLPALLSIVETPVMRADGTIFDTPGYGPETRLFYSPTPGFKAIPVPHEPTRADIDRAADKITELFHDFPFVDECSRTNAWAALLTCPLRPLLQGNIPLCMFDKPQPGTGGSLLAESIALVATGRDVAMVGAPNDEDEWRKAISSHLLAGHPIVIFDNVEHMLESDSLARVMTCTVWQDRMLGTNVSAKLPARTVWMATGNNVTLGRQMVRRCYQVRIDAQTSRPERRTGFKHPDLLAWIKRDRPEIIWAALTLCRAWAVAGSPDPSAETPIVGSFENWCRTLGGILEFTGQPGFLGNLEETRDASGDDEHSQWEGFLTAVSALYGANMFSVSQIEAAIPTDKRLRDSLPMEFSNCIRHVSGTGFSIERYDVLSNFKVRMGKSLKKRENMRYGKGMYVMKAALDSHTRTNLYRVIRGGVGVELTEEQVKAVPF